MIRSSCQVTLQRCAIRSSHESIASPAAGLTRRGGVRTTVTLMAHDALSLVVSFRVRNAAASSFRAFSAALSILMVSSSCRLSVSLPVRMARTHPRRIRSISEPMSGAALVEVVGEFFSEHADALVAENEALLDGGQESSPVTPLRLGLQQVGLHVRTVVLRLVCASSSS